MGGFMIIVGGVIGFLVAAASYLGGVGLLWSLVIYAAVGNGFAAWALWRFQREGERDALYLSRELEAEMEALREWKTAQEQAEGRGPILFRALRLQEQDRGGKSGL